jgi:4-hydroxy-2,2'-bipyrrole-5-carbaldehyde O-methyltransferase
MGFRAMAELLWNKQLFLVLKLSALFTPFYRLSYIAALINNGFLEILAEKPLPFDELAHRVGIEKENFGALKAWLQAGMRLKEIGLEDGGYTLRGISAKLARAGNDSYLAIVQEVTSLHHQLILETPQKLRNGERWRLDDQDGEVIARSSRILEPFQREAINATFPATKPLTLLEVGCGSGVYLKYAAEHNPQLSAIGVELQPSVAEMARRNIASWGLQEQVKIEGGDIRGKTFGHPFDIVTLYNNIYYFPVSERVALLEHLRSYLKPNGFLLLTTGCQGGQTTMEILNLWGATTQGCDRLPFKEEMTKQMESAGFVNVKASNLLPSDSFYMFVGYSS